MNLSQPRDIVEEQVAAYNARDLERFLSYYAPSAVIRDSSGATLYEGREAMRPVYEPLFSQCPALHVDIPSRLHIGQWVIDEEFVTGIDLPGAPTEMRAIAIYHVVDGMIQRVQFLT